MSWSQSVEEISKAKEYSNLIFLVVDNWLEWDFIHGLTFPDQRESRYQPFYPKREKTNTTENGDSQINAAPDDLRLVRVATNPT